jgi:GNAT superfamily N-acetyltransferase
VTKYKIPLPNLDILEKEMVSIPVGSWISSIEREHIVNSIILFSKNNIELRLVLPEDYKELNPFYDNILTQDAVLKIYILYIQGKTVSTAKLWIERKVNDPVGHIENVLTIPSERHKGYGKLAVSMVKEQAFKEGCYKVVLSCKNEFVDFYKSCGFNPTGIAMTAYKETT